METKDYRSLCIACLCPDRNLKEIQDSQQLKFYYELLSEIEVYDNKLTLRICWECEATLYRWKKFKEKAKRSYRLLLNFLQEKNFGCISTIAQKSKLLIHKEINSDYPPQNTEQCQLDILKTDVKQEYDGQTYKIEDNHFDSDDNFDNDVTVDSLNLLNVDNGIEGTDMLPVENDIEEAVENDMVISVDTLDRQDVKKVKRKKKKMKKNSIDKKFSEDEAPLSMLKSVDNETKFDLEALDTFDKSEIALLMLTPEEMVKERENDRIDEYYLKSPFRCEKCIAGFLFEHTYKNHLNSKHKKSVGVFVCPTCDVRFATFRSLEEHSVEHRRRFKCIQCGKSYETLKSTVRHVKNHKEHVCDKCGVTSSSLFRHQAHLVKAHKEKSYCVECKKHFSSRKTFRYHFNVIHKGDNAYPCPHCGKVYQWKSNLWRHMKNHKARESGELVCVPCEKKFSSVATYQMHLKSSKKHVTEEDFTYECDQCQKKYPTKTRLKDHMNWEHLRKFNYKCSLCEKFFKSSTSLYVHTQNVHKNKSEKDNLCHVCGKSYQNSAKLKYHIVAMHTSETPYNCNLCSSSFSWYSSLYRHVKEIHQKEKSNKVKKIK